MASIQERHPIFTRQYWPLRDELHIIEGLVFRGETLVIPPSMRHELLTKLHESHLGIEKCKASARPIMYWSGMGRDIEETISSHMRQIQTSLPIPASHLSLMLSKHVHGQN